MKNILLALAMFFLFSIVKAQNNSGTDYKVSQFDSYDGWVTICITSGNNITILGYANQNQYHRSGIPYYIIQGTILAPNGNNKGVNGYGDPNAGVVKFNSINITPGKEGFQPYEGNLWYKSDPYGKDRLEKMGPGGKLIVMLAN